MPETTPKPFAHLADSIGRNLHGDRWEDIKAQAQATAEAAALRVDRKARSQRRYDVAVAVFASIAALLILASLAAVAVAAWRWAL